MKKSRKFCDHRIYELEESHAMFVHPDFDVDRKTVLYIHGYQETLSQESVNVVVNAYLKRKDHNVLVLDWSELANGNYALEAVPNCKQVSEFNELIL